MNEKPKIARRKSNLRKKDGITWCQLIKTVKLSLFEWARDSVGKNNCRISHQTQHQTFAIGGFMDPTRLQGGFNGKNDDVRIYDRALSAEEVSDLYDLETKAARVGFYPSL